VAPGRIWSVPRVAIMSPSDKSPKISMRFAEVTPVFHVDPIGAIVAHANHKCRARSLPTAVVERTGWDTTTHRPRDLANVPGSSSALRSLTSNSTGIVRVFTRPRRKSGRWAWKVLPGNAGT